MCNIGVKAYQLRATGIIKEEHYGRRDECSSPVGSDLEGICPRQRRQDTTSVAVISASILSQTPCVIENLAQHRGCHRFGRNACATWARRSIWDPDAGVMEVDSSTINRTDVPLELCRRMRASSHYIGALLARFGRRGRPRCPADAISGAARLTSTSRACAPSAQGWKPRAVMVAGRKPTGLTPVRTCSWIWSPSAEPSTSCWPPPARRASTTIYNAAKEPHIPSIWRTLRTPLGLPRQGRGHGMPSASAAWRRCSAAVPTPPFRIRLKPARGRSPPPRRMANATICGCIPTHMEALTAKLLEMGARVEERDDEIRVRSLGAHRAVTFKTQVYPGFPTDLQQPMSALLARRPALRPSWKISNPGFRQYPVGDGAHARARAYLRADCRHRGRAAAARRGCGGHRSARGRSAGHRRADGAGHDPDL